CSYDGAKPTDYQTYSLAAWTDRYKECIGNGGSDEQCQRAMPNFLYMALPIDHTLGFNPNTPTPASMVANNDLAFGQIVDALSHSPFWKNTLVIALEDDTQAAGDHVDAHRTFLLAAGGLAREDGARGQASHQECSFACVLKTVEVLFRLPQFSVYDRGAVPLHSIVVPTMADRNGDTYTAVQPPVGMSFNPPTGLLGRISSKLDWNGVDR